MNQPTNWQQRALTSEILAFLGTAPKLLQKPDAESRGCVALSIGNLLCWVHGEFEPVHQRYQPLNETPVSVFALGRQFQDVGRALLETNEAESAKYLRERWDGFLDEFEKVKTMVARALAEKGGNL